MEKKTHPEISVILPCRNEEHSLAACILKIQKVFLKKNIAGEIIVSDSSIDNSPKIAKKFNVILVKHDKEGYGRAYLEAFKVARGKYLFCADSDGSYDFEEIPRFLNQLQNGYDFIIGNRFLGTIEEGAMPNLHRYIGAPLLSGIFRLLFQTKIHDTQCGMRALKREVLGDLHLQTTGMEFASEMIIKSLNNKLKMKELPIHYYHRKGDSKLRSFTDGLRHLRFILHYKYFVKDK
jgi:glycosyltransferase involved in cell wall biosynthesis